MEVGKEFQNEAARRIKEFLKEAISVGKGAQTAGLGSNV